MSRTGGIRPEYRLRFGYPYVTIERVGAPPRRVRIDADDPREPLRGFAAEIERVGGRLKAVLPPSEVWRGTVAAQGATEAALRAGAQALGAELAEIEVALGPDGADGRRPAAAARRETIAEAQAFLERAGFGSVETTATPSLPGFHERAAASAPPRSVRRPVALAASGLAATLALSLWLGPWRIEAPEPKAEASPATVATVAAPAAPPLAEAPSTSARPAPSPTLTSVALAPSPPSPAAAADPAPRMAPVALAGRNMPVDLRPPSAPEAAAAASAYLAPRPRPAAPATEPETAVAQAGGPRPRAAAAAVTPLAPLDAAILDGRPRARPVAAEAVTASLDPALAAESVPPPPGGPLARPASPAASTPPVAIQAPQLVAAPNPSPAAMAALAAEAVRNAASEPRRIAARAQPAAPSPAFVRPQAEAPQVRTVRAQPPEAQIPRRPRREPGRSCSPCARRWYSPPVSPRPRSSGRAPPRRRASSGR
jgi:hypothetical protein